MDKKLDLETRASDHKGLKGIFEVLLRRFREIMHVLMMIPIYLIACLVLGFCLIPGIYFFKTVSVMTAEHSIWVQYFASGFSMAVGYFLYGFSLILMVPLVNFLIRGNLQAWRGPYYSFESFKWFVHNGLTYVARFTFLEFVTPSPLNILFYRLMGMKIGRGVVINTTWISDPSLIELGDKVTLGGSVTLVAHYGQGGLLIIAPVKIGRGSTIGLKATIMGGVEIGENVKILPQSVVMPKAIIPAGETWGGVPARKIDADPLVPQIKIA